MTPDEAARQDPSTPAGGQEHEAVVHSRRHAARDRSTARILGAFLAVLAIPVLIGGFSAAETIDLALGTAAGSALLLAAAVLTYFGNRGSSGGTDKR